MDPNLTPFGSQNRPKIHPKSDRFFDRFLDTILMPKWCPNGSQNHPKSIKNPSQTEPDLKNVIFSKIAPRLGETLIFEGPRSPKRSQNRPKTVQEPIKNPTKNSIEFWIDFLMILGSFWLPKWLQNRSKSDPKNVPKNSSKNQRKMRPKWCPKWMSGNEPGPPFWSLFSGLFFSGCQGPLRDPKFTILAPKMVDFSSILG